ncbi:MAG: hypothetical protein ACM3X6_02900 [Patescibacteria group bacterium]
MASLEQVAACLLIPVRKETPDELIGKLDLAGVLDAIGKVESSLGVLYLHSWDTAMQAAIASASAVFNAGKGPVKDTEIAAALDAMAQELGPGMQELTAEQAGKLLSASYLLGRYLAARFAEFTPKLQQIDELAQAWLKADNLYWVGNYYSAQLGQTVADAVRYLAIEQGLGRADVGRALKTTLGSQFKTLTDTYWRGLAGTAAERARSFGGVQTLVEAEIEEYEILPVGDERTCAKCMEIAKHTFRTEHAVALRDAVMAADDPEAVKALHPWLSMEEVQGATTEELVGLGQSLPPYHFWCRCTYVVTSFSETVAKAAPLELKIEQPAPAQEMLPGDLGNLEFLGSGAHLGGAGEKYIYRDPATGQAYLFKPAVSKGGSPEPFRAYVQQGASDVAKRIFEPGEFIEIRVVADPSGRLGTLQKLLPDVAGDLKAIPWQTLTAEQLKQIQREHVLDWAIGNFDSHPGNFIVAGGQVYGIDKEQAFRYLAQGDSWKMSLKYHPNAVYGEQEPLYNMLYRAFGKNDVDLDLQTVLPALQRLEAIPDLEYRAIWRPYAEALKGKGQAAEDLLDLIVKRKHEVREQFKAFYSDLLKQRYGGSGKAFKIKFLFADETTGAGLDALPLAARVLTKAELQAMDVKSLKQLARAQKIKYGSQMNKAELVEALADPDNAAAVSVRAKERLRAALEAKLAKAPKVIPMPPAPGADPFTDLGAIPARRHGVAVRRDKRIVEGQQVNICRINAAGREGWRLNCKITKPHHAQIQAAMRQNGAREIYLRRPAGRWANGVMEYAETGEDVVKALEWITHSNGVTVELRFVPDGLDKIYAMNGYFEARVFGTQGQAAATALRESLDKLGLADVAAVPSAEDDQILRLSRLLWQHAPAADARLPADTRTIAQLEQALRDAGIDPARAARLVEKEVAPGYVTYTDIETVNECRQAGALYAWRGVDKADDVVSIVTPNGSGLASTRLRWFDCLPGEGASESSDMKSGGADNAFLRLAVQSVKGSASYNLSFGSGEYQLIYDLKLLERTDWYFYHGDSFGTTKPEMMARRLSPKESVAYLNASYKRDNEVMLRRGIGLQYLTAIHTNADYKRTSLIGKLKQAGITEINGVPVEQFVVVRTKLGL